MIRKIVSFIVLVPLGLMIALFAVANRAQVRVSLDPFANDPPMYSWTSPLFVILLTMVIAGVIIGGIAAWARQHRWRRQARQLAAELKAARAETEALRHAVEAAGARPGAVAAIPYRRSSAA